jgi:hypothetical protein
MFYEDFSSYLLPHRPPKTAAVGVLVMVDLELNPTVMTERLVSHDVQHSTTTAKAQRVQLRLRSSCRVEQLSRLREFVFRESVVELQLVERSFRKCYEVLLTLEDFPRLDFQCAS